MQTRVKHDAAASEVKKRENKNGLRVAVVRAHVRQFYYPGVFRADRRLTVAQSKYT